MYYTVYKVTNKVNGKYYIGKHQTVLLTDSYMGSGKGLLRAIQKYGSHNFVKEILHIFDNEEDMNTKEAELVIVSEDTYNLHEGGHGGFGYINNNGLNGYQTQRKLKKGFFDPEVQKRCQSPEAKQRRKDTFKQIGHQQGSKNSQFGISRAPWNKGLTKEDPRVAKYGLSISKTTTGRKRGPYNKDKTR